MYYLPHTGTRIKQLTVFFTYESREETESNRTLDENG